MKKLLLLLLLSPLGFTNIPASVFKTNETFIGKTCKESWKYQADINKCVDSWLLAKSQKDIYLPENLEGYKGTQTTTKKPSEFSALQNELNKMVELKTYSTGCRTKLCITAWLVDYGFFLTSDNTQFLAFRKDNELNGYLDSTTKNDDGETFGFRMKGAYEVGFIDNKDDRFDVTIYAWKNECTYRISKKAKYYWFDKIKANYSNICPSMLMERVRLPKDPFAD